MSKYSTNPVPTFKDAALLIAALQEMGFEANEIEHHAIAQQLFDYHGQPTKYTDRNGDKANVILRRTAVNRHLSGGASNDIGFKQHGDGSFSALISQYDSAYANNQWIGKLTAAYTRQSVIQKAAKQGFKFVGSRQENGKTKLQFSRVGR